MTNAPPVMYVRGKPNGAMGRWHDATSLEETAEIASGGSNPMFRYIRADAPAAVVAEMPGAQALVGAAYEAAVAACEDVDFASDDPDTTRLVHEAISFAGSRVRALRPDALAALDRLLAEAEARGVAKERERATGIAKALEKMIKMVDEDQVPLGAARFDEVMNPIRAELDAFLAAIRAGKEALG